jgi:hypothetical protein
MMMMTDSTNNDRTPLSGRELYHLQFSLQAASPETFCYTVVGAHIKLWHSIECCAHWGLI